MNQRQSLSQRVLDFMLVVLAAIALIVINTSDNDLPEFACLGAPLAYLILSPLLTNADLPSVAGRVYLLCFLTSLVTLVNWSSSLFHCLADFTPDPAAPQAAQQMILATITSMLPELLTPLGLGIVVYAATSVFEVSAIDNRSDTESGNLVGQISQWFEKHGASGELVEYIKQIVETSQQLEKACGSLAGQAVKTEHGLNSLGQAAARSEQALEGLNALKGLESDLVRVTAGVDQLNSAVMQMGQVVDELSEIISKKILEL
ncbi:MAG: hypothetical protein KDB03_18485 [Planctomycetales bacterium]|nr:hypothetical protein [Planctomycetales bacterium]